MGNLLRAGEIPPFPFSEEFLLPTSNLVSLKVQDVIGRVAATVVDETKESGNCSVQFDASKLSGGIYFARLQSKDKVQSMKVLLIK